MGQLNKTTSEINDILQKIDFSSTIDLYKHIITLESSNGQPFDSNFNPEAGDEVMFMILTNCDSSSYSGIDFDVLFNLPQYNPRCSIIYKLSGNTCVSGLVIGIDYDLKQLLTTSTELNFVYEDKQVIGDEAIIADCF